MAGYNPTNDNNAMMSAQNNPGFFSRLLRNISNWGMNYNDMVVKNSVAVSANAIPTGNNVSSQDMYSVFSRNAVSKLLDQKSISYLDPRSKEKQAILREYANKDKIKDMIQIVVDEAILYDDTSQFCHPIELPAKFEQAVKERLHENFAKIYRAFNFDNGLTAWNYFRRLLVDGFIAFEIVYDSKQKNIIGLNALEANTLIPGYEPLTGDFIWIQFPDDPQNRKLLLDAQIIYISYSNTNEYTETSYTENLIRPYNQLRLIEQSRIMYNIINASMYRTFKIPVGGMSRQLAEEQISKLIADYKDEVSWDDSNGTVSINGSAHIPYSKDYWFPSGESGSPEMTLTSPQGHDLNEEGMLKWFHTQLKRASRIPVARFEESSGGGSMLGSGSFELTRDEISFFYFISRLRTLFKEILVKPLKIQMILDYPELKDDDQFMSSINVEFNGVNLFHEWRELMNFAKRAEIVSTLNGQIQDSEGKPWLPIEYSVRRFLKLTEEEIQEIEKYRITGTTPAPGDGSASPTGDTASPIDMGGGEPIMAEPASTAEPAPDDTIDNNTDTQAPPGDAPDGGEFTF
jgi:hypothetical protein